MARRVIQDTYYTFDPSTKTVVIPRFIPQERIITLVNTTTNSVLYNFADINLAVSSYTANSTAYTTTIILNTNISTTGMVSTDAIQIVVDEINEYVVPAEAQLDPVGKMRVSNPQSLIDTDFEYGLQPTKWESLFLNNNRPSFFSDMSLNLPVSNVAVETNKSTVTVTANASLGSGVLTTSTTNTSVTGIGTLFTTQLNYGFALYANGLSNSFIGLVSSISNNTNLFLQSNSAINAASNGFFTLPVTMPTNGSPFILQDTLFPPANGPFLVDNTTEPDNFTFTYTSRSAYTGTNTSIYDSAITTAFIGSFFSGAAYNVATVNTTPSGVSSNLLYVTTNGPHGLTVGNPIYVTNGTVLPIGSNSINGSFTVSTILSSNVFVANLASVTNAFSNGIYAIPTIYPGAAAQFSHRSYDGGVYFTTGTTSSNQQAIRQTRRVFRYQAGKAIQMSTASLLKPDFQIDNANNVNFGSGNTILITTRTPHNLTVGANVFVYYNSQINVNLQENDTAYTGTFAVTNVVSTFAFNYVSPTAPRLNPAPGILNMNVTNWYGASVRTGMFDAQNGFFYEYDGQILYAVRRNSTTQLSGIVNVTNGSPTITGALNPDGSVFTQFSRQLLPGDFVVIRGMSYKILSIESDTSMTVTPPYRGITLSGLNGAILSKTIDFKVPQSEWNIDRCDNSGPSGYGLDLTKVQMFYMDYSWYGAGAIRFGFKDNLGQIIYCHRMIHNNQLNQSFMRSGNLPARYEVNTFPPTTQFFGGTTGKYSNLTVSDTTMFVANGLVLPSTGTVLVDQEYITYTARSSTQLTGLTRAVKGGTLANTHTYSNTSPKIVSLSTPNFSPILSHWGTSVIMDGRYDDDKSYIFSSPGTTAASIPVNGTAPIISLRLSPAVDNGVPNLLGAREIINRMQLTLQQMDIYSNGNFLIKLFLNAKILGDTWQNVGGSSLSQVCYHTASGINKNVQGGEQIYAFFSQATTAAVFTVTQQELNKVRDLGNSILGGGTTNSTGFNIYPDGPDVLTIVAQNIGNVSSSIYARLSWSEAQA